MILLSVFLISACKKKAEKPDFINQENFINMLIDIHITDASMSENNIYRSGNNYRPSYYYNSIYSKYNLDKQKFDSVIGYYTANLDEFETVYEKVIDSLNRLETKLKIELSKSKEIMDTLNLWENKSIPKLVIEDGETKNDTLSFDIPTYNTRGLYTIKAKYKLHNDDSADNLFMNAFFMKKNKDSISISQKIHFDTLIYKINASDTNFIDIKLQLELSDSTYSNLKVNFYNTKSKEGEYNRHFEIKEVFIYNPNIKPKLSEKLMLNKRIPDSLMVPIDIMKK